MKLTRTRKKLVGVLAVGAAAFFVDRYVLPEPASSIAAEQYLITNKDKPATSQPAASDAHWGAVGIPNRLQRLERFKSDNSAIRDPFRRAVVAAQAISEDPGVSQRTLAEQFAKAHPLKGIVSSGRQGMIMMSDRIVHIGEKIDGWELVAIEPDVAVFQRGEYQLRLKMPRSFVK